MLIENENLKEAKLLGIASNLVEEKRLTYNIN